MSCPIERSCSPALCAALALITLAFAPVGHAAAREITVTVVNLTSEPVKVTTDRQGRGVVRPGPGVVWRESAALGSRRRVLIHLGKDLIHDMDIRCRSGILHQIDTDLTFIVRPDGCERIDGPLPADFVLPIPPPQEKVAIGVKNEGAYVLSVRFEYGRPIHLAAGQHHIQMYDVGARPVIFMGAMRFLPGIADFDMGPACGVHGVVADRHQMFITGGAAWSETCRREDAPLPPRKQ